MEDQSENNKPELLTTNRKALTINLDDKVYGSFAEIGAGQETARHFFQAGGAAGTVAKSMSAYDMKFSDVIYGKSSRYVSRERLDHMLDHEYTLLPERLEQRAESTCFFAFANTVAAKSYRSNRDCHGWLGIRFQCTPMSPPNNIVIHVHMLDDTNVKQQEAVGIIGVNLIYAAFFLRHDTTAFVRSLLDNIESKRIEVDMISFSGPDFSNVDNRLLSLKLLQNNLTKAIIFTPEGDVAQPSEILYKSPVLLQRGSFRPITKVNEDMIRSALTQFQQERRQDERDPVVLLEITMNNLLSSGEISTHDFLARVDLAAALGYNMMISNYFEFYKLVAYFRQYSKERIGIVLGSNNLQEIFTDIYYDDLEGGILEAFGRLFKQDVKLYAYPMTGLNFNRYLDNKIEATTHRPSNQYFPDDVLITAQNLPIKPHLLHLYQHMLNNGFIQEINHYSPEISKIFSRDVLRKIVENEGGWEDDVPEKAVQIIKNRQLWSPSNTHCPGALV
jgi:hypothetical protein